MIRRLRKRHRQSFLALLLLVGPLLVLGLLGRHEVPPPQTPVLGAAPEGGSAVKVYVGQQSGLAYSIDLVGARVRVIPTTVLAAHPEWSLYWAQADDDASSVHSMWFLGVVSGESPASYPVPAAQVASPGWLVLYSLTQDEIIETIAI